MNTGQTTEDEQAFPALRELGADLTRVTSGQRISAIAVPFLCAVFYALCAYAGWWPVAVFSLMCLSFITYGSTSHDLVHRNLGLTRRANDLFLCLIELLALRSGHAYRTVHLHHHARYPNDDDIEGRASRMTFIGALIEGLSLQTRIWFWAIAHAKRDKAWIYSEGITSLALMGLAVFLCKITPIPIIYVVLMIMGSWIIPLITAYIPHNPHGETLVRQTRLFRGRFVSIIALEHLYHLEHHMYPSVPHQNWPRLAKRLDPYFTKAGIKPKVVWF